MAQHLITHTTKSLSPLQQQCVMAIRHWVIAKQSTKETIAQIALLHQQAAEAGMLGDVGFAEHVQGYIQHYLGNLDLSMVHYERAQQMFEKAQSLPYLALAYINQSENHRLKAKFSAARDLCHNAHEIATQLGSVYLQAYALVNQGWILFNLGNDSAALHNFENGRRLCEQWVGNENGLAILRCEIHHGIAQVLLKNEHYKAALEQARLAFENADLTGDMISFGLAYRTLGDVMSSMGYVAGAEFEDADEYYRTALSAFNEIEAQGEVARTLMAHAYSLARRERGRSAAKLLQDAIAIFTRLGMRADAARAAETQLLVTRYTR